MVRITSRKDYGDDLKSKFIELNIQRGSDVGLTRERKTMQDVFGRAKDGGAYAERMHRNERKTTE